MPDFDRFRSFAERYVVARAEHFRIGHEREDAWSATMDAKTVYGNIARMASDAEPDMGGNATQAGTSAGSPGGTGAMNFNIPPKKPRSATPNKPATAAVTGPMGPPGTTGVKGPTGLTPPWLKNIIDKVIQKEGTPDVATKKP